MNSAGAIIVGGASIFSGIVIPIIIPSICLIVYCVAIYKIVKISKHNSKHDKEAHNIVKFMGEKVDRLRNFNL